MTASKKTKSSFPTFVYVKEEDDGAGEKFFVTSRVLEDHTEISNSVEVAEYELKSVYTVKLVPVIEEKA